MNASPVRSPYRSPDYYPTSPSASPTKVLRDIADEEYDPTQPSICRLTPEPEWLLDNPHVVEQDTRLQELVRAETWTPDDKSYVHHIIGQFSVHDMPSFFRVQAHQWILYNMDVLGQNKFLDRMFDKMRRGEGFSARDADTLKRTVWRLMSDTDRRVASASRRDAERLYGRMERPRRQRPRMAQDGVTSIWAHRGQWPRMAPPMVAGYPFELAEAYLNYHRSDLDRFALSWFEQHLRSS